MKKWIKILIIVALGTIILLFCKKFLVHDYKKEESGNNKSIQEIEAYILNIDSFKAKLSVTVKSNKNVNFYKLEQEVKQGSKMRQIALEPEDIAGIEIVYQNGIMQINNSKYNLSKVYNDYPYISDNSLFLTSFINEYKNASEKSINEVDGKIEMALKSVRDRYNNEQKLYINKSDLKPENLQILDINNNCRVDIQYSEIEFNI